MQCYKTYLKHSQTEKFDQVLGCKNKKYNKRQKEATE